jgi:hypothetical protein
MSEIPKWQASIHFLYPGEATSGRTAVHLAADVDVAIAAAEQRVASRTVHHAADEFQKAIVKVSDSRYAAGVQAAREAVFATTVGFGIAVDAPIVVAYLAAIDALEGK